MVKWHYFWAKQRELRSQRFMLKVLFLLGAEMDWSCCCELNNKNTCMQSIVQREPQHREEKNCDNKAWFKS